MLSILLGSIFIALGVFISEYLGRKRLLKEESSRKIPHVVSSVVIAVVALFISIRLMEFLLLLDTILILIVIKYNMFSFARYVDRLSWGELFFPIGLILAAFISSNKWIFIASVLVLGLADAAAALVGKAVGKHKYKIFGQSKSYEGSLAFLVTTVIVLALVIFVAPSGLSASWGVLIFISFWATIVEGITPWGADNLLVPILIASALRLL